MGIALILVLNKKIPIAKDTFLPFGRETRRPINKYFMNSGQNKNSNSQAVSPLALIKEHRDRICLDITRRFHENRTPFNMARSPWNNMLSFLGIIIKD